MRALLKKEYPAALGFWVIALAVLLTQVSSQSFWTDEAIRLYSIVFEGWKEALDYAVADKQLLYVATEFVWCRVFGSGEWALRAMNIPFALIMLAYLRQILRCGGRSPWYALLLLVQPVFAYYVNEASPYLMLGAFGTAFIYYAVYANKADDFKNLLKLNLFFALGLATHFIFAFVYAVYLTALFWRLKTGQTEKKALLCHAKALLCFITLYLALAFVVMSHLSGGAERGWGMPDAKNLAAIVYLFMGLGGLCFSRNELRAKAWNTLTASNLILTAAYLAVLLCLFIVLVRRKKLKAVLQKHGLLLWGSLVYFAVFWAVSMVWKFQMWERHVFILIVPLVLVEAEVLYRLKPQQTNRVLQGVIILLVVLQGVSCFQLRFSKRYGKDDYRGVAECLRQASQNGPLTIFTSGYHLAFRFYGVAPQDGSGIPTGAGDQPSQPIDGWSVQQIENALSAQSGRVAVVLNEKEMDADVYHWAGPQGAAVTDEYNSFRVVWVDRAANG